MRTRSEGALVMRKDTVKNPSGSRSTLIEGRFGSLASHDLGCGRASACPRRAQTRVRAEPGSSHPYGGGPIGRTNALFPSR